MHCTRESRASVGGINFGVLAGECRFRQLRELNFPPNNWISFVITVAIAFLKTTRHSIYLRGLKVFFPPVILKFELRAFSQSYILSFFIFDFETVSW